MRKCLSKWLAPAVLALTFSASTQSIVLQSVVIDTSGQVVVSYSKDLSECAVLVDITNRRTTLADLFCESGTVEVSEPLFSFGFVDNQVRLCVHTIPGSCSDYVQIVAPAHPLHFYLSCDLVQSLADEIDEAFDCVAPSVAILDELTSRLNQYTADLNLIFSRQTVRFFDFDPVSGIHVTDVDAGSPGCCLTTPNPFGFEIWIRARLSENITDGGFANVDMSGAIVADGLYWDLIHDPGLLQDNSPQLIQYWRQIYIIVHELEHGFGAGFGEYYKMIRIDDTTGVDPVENINLYNSDVFWGQHPSFFADPLLLNISPTINEYTQLLDLTKFANVTAAIVNSPWDSRTGITGIQSRTPDLSHIQVRVLDSQCLEPIEGAVVKVWNVISSPPYLSSPVVEADLTDADGAIEFSWGDCAEFSCESGNDHMRLVKVFANSYEPGLRWFSIYDAQEVKMVELTDDLVIEIRLAPSPTSWRLRPIGRHYSGRYCHLEARSGRLVE